MIENVCDLNSIKLKMLDEFYFELKNIFKQYFDGNISIDKFKVQINKFFDSWNVCRLDLRIDGENSSSVKTLNNESYLTVKYPKWLADGRGCVIESNKNLFNLDVECSNSGTLKMYLKGRDFRGFYQNRVPIYVNYKKLMVNDRLIFNDNQCVWHNTPYFFYNDCGDGEKFEVQIEFETIFDFYPKLVEFQNLIEISSQDSQSLKEVYDLFEYYVFQQKFNPENVNQVNSEYLDMNMKIIELKSEFNKLQSQLIDNEESTHELFSMLFLDAQLNTKGVLNNVQTLSQELLNFVVNVCNKYELPYWLDFGTLLGAIRHDGYIPWDDDVDIGMMRCDMRKFLMVIDYEIKNNNLDEYVSVNFDRIYEENILPFVQIFYSPEHLLGAVDIFPYDYIKNPADDLAPLFLKERKKFRAGLKEGVPREEIEPNYFNKLNISHSPQKHIITGVGNPYNKLFLVESKDVFPLKECNFNGDSYNSPNNHDKYLTEMYGDYGNIPKKIKRHGRINFLKTIPNSEVLFKKHIEILKNVNKNFIRELNIK